MAGIYFDDFEPGKIYKHEASRTLTLGDSMQYACMCMETEPTYLDEDWSRQHAPHQRIEVSPMYVLALIVGIPVTELTLGTTLGNLAMGDITFPNPVFPGDTLRAQTKILGKKESKTRPDRGVVEFLHEGFNQRGELVVTCSRKGMMVRRSAG